jgi:hypothetical protein
MKGDPFAGRKDDCLPCAWITSLARTFLAHGKLAKASLPMASCSGICSLITLLWLSIGPAGADWVNVADKTEKGLTVYTVYVDPDSVRRNGDLVMLWALFDFRTIQSIVGGPWLSSKAQREFDCPEERVRLLGFMTFTGNMGSGEPVYSNAQESKWEPIASESIDRKLWEFACNKK